MTHPHLLVTRDAGVCEILIDRPEARNALSTAMFDALTALFGQADQDRGIGCVLLAGAGEHFSARRTGASTGTPRS
jgi:enoyl-CoA hydratase/carnithine racemase